MNIESTTLVQIRFVVDKGGPDEFADALYFTPEQFVALTPEQLETAQIERVDNWKAMLAAAAAAPVKEVTEEEVLADIVTLEEQRAAIDEQLAAKSAELAVLTASSPTSGVKGG